MSMLSIHLQEGFGGDVVIIAVNGEEVFREEEVRTKLLLGYAAIIDVQVDRSPAEVAINLPGQKITETIRVPLAGDTYLGISVQNDKIAHHISKQPFGYA